MYDSLNVLYAVGLLQKHDKKVFCNKSMVAELEEAFLDQDSEERQSPSSGFDVESKQRECIKVEDNVVWLDKDEAEVMRKRIKDRELKMQAQIEAAEIGNAKTLQRISEKYQRVASMMNQQICLKRVQKRNEKREAKLAQKLKRADEKQEIRIKMPFVFVRASSKNKYKPEKYEEKSLHWKIKAPLNLYGDTDVLELMQMGEIRSDNDIKEFLGDFFVEKRDFFVETGDMIKEKKAKYVELFRKYREDKLVYDYKH